MKLYLKILQFLKPFWKAITVSLLLTFIYVLFNNLSLWISVDFVRELFEPEQVQSEHVVQKQKKNSPSDMLGISAAKNGFYEKINKSVKSLLIRNNRYDTLLMVCLVIFLSFFFKNVVFYLRQVILAFIELKIVVNIRNKLHHALMHLPFRFFEKRHSGDLTSIVFNDVNAVNVVLNNSFGKMILSPVQILANIVILIMISWKLSLITFLVIPVSTFVIVKIGQSIRRKNRRVFREISNVVSVFTEGVTAVRIVKAFANEDKEIEKFEAANRAYFKRMFAERRLRFATSPINEIILVLILVFLLWYGGNMVYSHSGLKPEDFIRFLVFLFTMFQPIKDLSGINNTVQAGLAAAERIFAVIDSPTEIYEPPHAIELKQFKNDITYENVSFKYNDDQENVLRDINITVHKGETVAIVGPSGAGKTTFANLLPRFYEPTTGRILIDGVDSKRFTLASLRKKMSIVTQDIILFNDTIRQNIAYGMETVSEEEIIHAAKVANAWEFIQQQEKGLDTHIGEKGIRISGGQKQRLSIARAILKNPPILILDEATSSLDTESERLVQEAIDNLLENRTVLVIAHRLSTIKNADRIVVLNQGKIEAMGRHSELIQKSPVYKNLYENQLLSQTES